MNTTLLSEAVNRLKSDNVQNYVIAGLDSYLLNNGTVRLFKNSRKHQDSITPHSHRYDLFCLVIKGKVINKIWRETTESVGDLFCVSELEYSGQIGVHKSTKVSEGYYTYQEKEYGSGETYYMTSEDIHSIDFSKGAEVLIFETPNMRNTSLILEPIVRGGVIKTYKKLPYMFKTDKSTVSLNSLPPISVSITN